MEDYGYMFVTWQTFNRKENSVFFQGVAFSISISMYRDDFFAMCDTMQDWYIPLETFKRWHKNGDIIEITRDEFINKFSNNIREFSKKWLGMLNNIEQQWKQ